MSSASIQTLSGETNSSPGTASSYRLSHLRALEAESIHIMREVAAQFEKPVLLYSIGKDSSVMLHLARKAFFPGKLPFPLLHIDTTYEYPEMIEFRDRFTAEIGADLKVYTNLKAINEGANPYDLGTSKCCGLLRTRAVVDGLRLGGYDAALGGARRDEERSRAKERVFSFRDAQGQWDPKNQRPELWNIFNGRKHFGEHFRVFPLSNWTEMDVWQYIRQENIPLPSLYFSHTRRIIERHGQLLDAETGFIPLLDEEKPQVAERVIRFRTVGDATCTGAVASTAATLDEIIAEVAAARQTERGTRADDKRSETAMEDRKKEGYF